MKSIQISHSIKQSIATFEDGSYDDNINQLIDLVGDYMPLVDLDDESRVIININDDTVDKINSFKLTAGESINNILVRMFILSQILNNSDE